MVLGGEVRIRGMRQRIRGMFLEDCQECVCFWVGGRGGGPGRALFWQKGVCVSRRERKG